MSKNDRFGFKLSTKVTVKSNYDVLFSYLVIKVNGVYSYSAKLPSLKAQTPHNHTHTFTHTPTH